MWQLRPDDISIHFELPPIALPNDLAAIDTEFFHMQKEKLHRPHGDFGCIGVTLDGKNVYMIFDERQVQAFYDNIRPATQVYANAGFDIIQMRRFANIPETKKLWDVMLVEQIQYSGYYDSFALNDLSNRYLDLYLPKDVRASFNEGSGRMTDEQIFYAACDIVATWHVAKAQRDAIDDDDAKIWTHIERPFFWKLLDRQGMMMDVDGWVKMADDNANRFQEILAQLNGLNPNSSKQVKDFFLDKYKIKLDSSDEASLTELLAEHPECVEAQLILDSRGANKLSSTYGREFVEKYVESDGRIHPAYWQIGAATGRLSSSNPNAQNIPHDPAFRSKFIAAPGNSLVIADYSSQEPRILAALSNDAELIEIFKSGKDVYIEAGYRVFGERFEKKDPRRQYMKAIVLGIPYGMSVVGLAPKMGVDKETAGEMLNKFFGIFTGVHDYLREKEEYRQFVQTIYGRKFWLNPYQQGWYRNALNSPIQGSAADCTKRAVVNFVDKMGYNPVVALVHDEIVVEVPTEQAEEVGNILRTSMIEEAEIMHPHVPSNSEVYIAQTWAGKG